MTDSVSPSTHLIIKGARQHNLKNINLTLPKNKLVVFTGLSGSGKSSLAFDTIYAEGQRRYVESLSSYARQFLGIMQKPDVDSIDGLSPAISIDQKTTSHNPRSTVGTITEIYDYLRLLFARIGHPHCPNCGSEIAPQTLDQIAQLTLEEITKASSTTPQSRWFILSPVVRDKKGEFTGLFDNLRKKGFERVRVDGHVYALTEDFLLIKTNRHSIDVIVERFTANAADLKNPEKSQELLSKLRKSIEQALELSNGLTLLSQVLDPSLDFPAKPTKYNDKLYSQQLACPNCNTSMAIIEPRLFSFNTPHGACPTCTGLGNLLKIDPQKLIAPDISIPEGAIIPLANALSSDSWYSRKIRAILKTYNVDPNTPYKDLPEDIKHIILYGDKEWYRVEGNNREGRQASFSFQPEGVVHELERRYQETESDFIRSEFSRYMTKEVCKTCGGDRLKAEALAVTIDNQNIAEVCKLPINKALSWVQKLQASIADEADTTLNANEKKVALSIFKEVSVRLNFLVSVGLNYLNLSREAETLAGGEAQRIRLASQIGTGLTGVLYVLDEPTIGLHPRDNDRLIQTLTNLRDLGNSVVVVEHDENVMRASDQIIDIGPGAGIEGGHVTFAGTLDEMLKDKNSLTGLYLSGKKRIDSQSIQKKAKSLHSSLQEITSRHMPIAHNAKLTLTGVTHHNLKNVTADFPLGKLVVITGVSGSGKSSLVHETLYPALKQFLGLKADEVGKHQALIGADQVNKVFLIDQSPIGRTPRSNPATYTKIFDAIRELFASTRDARERGFKAGRFSFNVKGGRCEACQGGGEVKISMQFLPDVYVTCEVCKGKRYNQETLSVFYRDKTISEVLNFSIQEALDFFTDFPGLTKKLATLQAVGLNYIKLGQPATTLSGGEAQRVKLAKELSLQSSGHSVYLLDEPTTGLHFEDVKHLLVVLKQLVAMNNTVIVVEHNLDVIKNADYVIDLGPEGGDGGGEIIATGTPAEIKANPSSLTGKYLA